MISASALFLGAFALSRISDAASLPSGAAACKCLEVRNVPVSLPGSINYEDLAEPFNLRLPYKPVAIVLPTTEKHISDALICAAQTGVKVQAKSGGHSYASFSSGGKDGSIMIDLHKMYAVELDKSTNIVKIGGGARLGHVAEGLYNQGKRALPHGTCLGVGVGGHSTHGGYGHTSRKWGVMLDRIVAADVVLANGTITHADFEQNADLFWALRGAADSFAVIYNFYMKTEPAPEKILFFQYKFTGMFDQKDTFNNAIFHLQEFGKNKSVVDDRISFGINFNGSAFSFAGNFFGTEEEYRSKIHPEFLRTLPAPTTTIINNMDWVPYLINFDGGATISVPTEGYDLHDNFFAKSITVPEYDGLTIEAVSALYDHVKKGSQGPWFTIINLYGGPGSAINEKTTEFAAYKDRDSLFVFQNYGVTAANMAFINGINEAVTKAQNKTEFGAYLNYVDPSLDANTAHDLYYGKEVYEKLLTLKKKYDPKMVLWNPQAIGV